MHAELTTADGKTRKYSVATPEIIADIIKSQLATNSLVTQANIDKQAEFDCSSFSIECEISWSTSVHIYLDNKINHSDPDARIHTLNLETMEETTYLKSTMKAGISWSSTTRNVAEATACVNLYQRAVQFAAAVEVILADYHYIQVQ